MRSVRPSWLLVWTLAIGIVELWGRASSNDLHDVALIAGLGVLAHATARQHRESPILWWGWVEYGPRAILRALASLDVDYGVDLRREPPYSPRLPRALSMTLPWSLVLVVLAFTIAPWLPDGARGLAEHGSVTLFLVALAALWTFLLAGIITMGALSLAFIHDRLLQHSVGRGVVDREPAPKGGRGDGARTFRRGGPRAARVCPARRTLRDFGHGGQLPRARATGARTSPPKEPRRADPSHRVDHRRRGLAGPSPPRGSRPRPAVVGRGRVRPDRCRDSMFCTLFLGRLLAWTGAAGLSAIALQFLRYAQRARRRDPAEPVVPRIRFTGGLSSEGPSALAVRFESEGLLVAHKRARGVCADLELEIVAPGAVESRKAWTLERLSRPDAVPRLLRLHELDQRAHFHAVLLDLHESTNRHSYTAGTGHWIAPHLWFVPRVCRDTDEDSRSAEHGVLEQIIAPDYSQVLARSARHHLFRVLRAVRIDIVFIEDGLPSSTWEQVFETLFDVYDMHGGERPVDERDFAFLPDARVILHDLAPEEPFESKVYPEPDYDEIGRARILHIFRDRGGEEDPVDIGAPGFHLPLGI